MNNIVYLWLDDVRFMPSCYNFWAKTAQEAIDCLKQGNVEKISFDHDLGMDGDKVADSGYDVAKWIEAAIYNRELKRFPEWEVHSANPVGRVNIEKAMHSALVFWNSYEKF